MSSRDMGPEGIFRWTADEVMLDDGMLVQVDVEISVYDGKIVEVIPKAYTDCCATWHLSAWVGRYAEIREAVYRHLEDRWDGGLAEVVCSDCCRV